MGVSSDLCHILRTVFCENMIDKDKEMEGLAASQATKISMCTDNNHNNSNSNSNSSSSSRSQRKSSSRIAEKYGLRPRTVVRRLQLEKGRDDLPGASSKTPRIRPPPLSKYRRKTANARERHRMKEINDAFETLRRVLPDICSRRAAAAMTKITTLKLAVNYIRALSHILQDGHPGDISFFDGLGIDDLSIEASAPLASRGPVLQCPGRGAFQQAFPTPSAALPSCSASAAGRGSSGSSSDLSDLLSDDSCVFEDNLDAFDDIPALPEADPFALLLNPEEEALALTS